MLYYCIPSKIYISLYFQINNIQIFLNNSTYYKKYNNKYYYLIAYI